MILQNKKQKRIWLVGFLSALIFVVLAFQILIQISNHQETVHLENKENAKKTAKQKNLALLLIPKCDSLISYRRHFYESCKLNNVTIKTDYEFWQFTENSIKDNTFLEKFDDESFRKFLRDHADYDDWWSLKLTLEGSWLPFHKPYTGINSTVNNFKQFTLETSVYNCASEQTMHEIETLWSQYEKENELVLKENNLQRIYYDCMAVIISVLGITFLSGYIFAFVKKRQALKLNKEG